MGRLARDEPGAVLPAALEKDAEVGDGLLLPFVLKFDGFLAVEESDLSARGRVVVFEVDVDDGLAEPVYPEEGRALAASLPGLAAPLGGGVGLEDFGAEPLLSSSAFLFAGKPLEGLDVVAVEVVGFSPVMEASS